MGVKHPYSPLAVVGGADDALDRYDAYLRRGIAGYSPRLVEEDVWTNDLLTEAFGFP